MGFCSSFERVNLALSSLGCGSPGLVVMGGGSCPKGRGFEFQLCILDGHDIFTHLFVVKMVTMFV